MQITELNTVEAQDIADGTSAYTLVTQQFVEEHRWSNEHLVVFTDLDGDYHGFFYHTLGTAYLKEQEDNGLAFDYQDIVKVFNVQPEVTTVYKVVE